jgi:hypothetical protein
MRNGIGSCRITSWVIYCWCASAQRHELSSGSGWCRSGHGPLSSTRTRIACNPYSTPGPATILCPVGRSAATNRRISRSSSAYGSARPVWGARAVRRSSAAFRLRAIPTSDGSVEAPGDCGAPTKHLIVITALPFPQQPARLVSFFQPRTHWRRAWQSASRRKVRRPESNHRSDPCGGFGLLTGLERLLTIPRCRYARRPVSDWHRFAG